MKKIAVFLFAVLFSAGVFSSNQAPEHKATHNKVTKGVSKGAHTAGKGVKHGAYDATHNKATKGMGVNKGNQKYKDKKDL